jgi:membrane protein DedA with SNARE-associated domain
LSLEDLISHYGVLAVLLGAALEGEAAVFPGGVFAHRGFMPVWQVAAVAALGSFAADQAWFFAGRYANRLSIVRRFMGKPVALKVSRWLEAHPTAFILSFRFIYGMRTVSPIMIGLSSISAGRFVALNFVAAVVWAILITAVGYLFGDAVEALVGRLRLHLHLLIAVVVVLAFIAAIVLASRRWSKSGAAQPNSLDGSPSSGA